MLRITGRVKDIVSHHTCAHAIVLPYKLNLFIGVPSHSDLRGGGDLLSRKNYIMAKCVSVEIER